VRLVEAKMHVPEVDRRSNRDIYYHLVIGVTLNGRKTPIAFDAPEDAGDAANSKYGAAH